MNERDLVYHGLAVKRHAAAATVARLVGVDEARVKQLLTAAVAAGRAVEAKGGFALTPLARLALEGRYSLHFGSLRDDPAFVAYYQSFERINRSLKQVITDWQTLEVAGSKIANDHSDAAYDQRVIGRLGDLHEQIEPVLSGMAARLPRLDVYRRKLTAALELAEDGELEWVSDVRRDSYHTMWFELHEDLLRIMGTTREE